MEPVEFEEGSGYQDDMKTLKRESNEIGLVRLLIRYHIVRSAKGAHALLLILSAICILLAVLIFTWSVGRTTNKLGMERYKMSYQIIPTSLDIPIPHGAIPPQK